MSRPQVFATVHEYRMVSPRLAKVTLSAAGGNQVHNQDALMDAVCAALNDGATPVRSSFRWLNGGTSAIGFVYASTETRPIDEKTLKASYREMAKNLYMSPEDEKLWEVKQGAAGSYLARQGQDDLTALLETSRVSPAGSQPRMRSVLTASTAKNEFLAFVSEGQYSAEMDYGFVTHTGDDGSIQVLSHMSNTVQVVNPELIVSSHSVARSTLPSLPKAALERHRQTAASATDAKLTSVEYYKLAYGHAPEYVNKIIQQINEMAAL